MQNKYNNCLDTFHNISFDATNNTYLVESKEQALNFDKIKEKACKNMKCVKSCDALYIQNQTYYLIEFKNSECSDNSKRNNVKDSFLHSLLILLDELNTTIKALKNNVIFILVYNPEKNHNKNKERLQVKTNNTNIIPNWLSQCAFERKFCQQIKSFNPQDFDKWLKTIK